MSYNIFFTYYMYLSFVVYKKLHIRTYFYRVGINHVYVFRSLGVF